MTMGMQGSALPLSELLNPTPAGQFRVGAMGTQLHSLSGSALRALLPLAMAKFQKRQEDADFQKQLMELPEDEREAAWKAKYHPLLYRSEEGKARQKAAQDAALEKERRASLAEAAKNQRELGEKIDAENRAQGRTATNMLATDELIRGRQDYAQQIKRDEEERDRKRLEGAFGDVGPEIGAMAKEIGVAFPEGKLRYMSSPKQKQKWQELTGDPGQDIVTDEDIDPIKQKYLQYKALMGSIPKKEIPANMSPVPWNEDQDAVKKRAEAGQGRYGPAVLLDDEEKMRDFQERTKIHGGDAAKAWSELRTDAQRVEEQKRDAHREIRTDDKAERDERKKVMIDLLKAKNEMAAAEAADKGVAAIDKAGKQKSQAKKAEAEAAYNTWVEHYRGTFGEDIPEYAKIGGGKASAAAPSMPRPDPNGMSPEERQLKMKELAELDDAGNATEEDAAYFDELMKAGE